MKQQIIITFLSLSSLQRWLLSGVLLSAVSGLWWGYELRSYQQCITHTQHLLAHYEKEYQNLLEQQHTQQKQKEEQQVACNRFHRLKQTYQQSIAESLTSLLSKAHSLGCITETVKCQPHPQKEWYSSYSMSMRLHTTRYSALKSFLVYCKMLPIIPQKCSITCTANLLTCSYSGKMIMVVEE